MKVLLAASSGWAPPAAAVRLALATLRDDAVKPAPKKLILAGVLFFSLAIRLMQAHEGLPYLHHWDEPQVASTALHMMRTGDLNPHFFNYGSFLIYTNLGVDVLHYYYLMRQPEGQEEYLRALDEIKTEHDTGWHWTISHPSFYLWNRWLTALFGTASVALVYFIGLRLGGPWAGLLAAGFLAGLPFHVQHSAWVTTDVPASFFVLAAVLLTLRHFEHGKPSHLIAALASAGLAASTKYNAAVVIAVPLLVFALGALRRSPARPPWLLAAVAIVPAAAFLAGTPCALLDLRKFLIDVGFEVFHYGIMGQGPATGVGWPAFAWQWSTVASKLGVGATALALLGIAGILARREGWIVLLNPVLYSGFMAMQRINAERNLIILCAFSAIAFGVGAMVIVRACAALAERLGKARSLAYAPPAIVIAILTLIPSVTSFSTAWAACTVPEPRTQALLASAALVSTAPSQARVGVPEEIRPHSLDLARMNGTAVVKPWLELVCDPSPYAAIVRPARFAGSYGEAKPSAEVLREAIPPGFRAVEKFGVGHLSLEYFSVRPALEVMSPSPDAASGTWICEARFGASDLESSVPYKSDPNGTLMMLAGGWVQAPSILAGPGRRTLAIRARGQAAQGIQARLVLTVQDEFAEGDPSVVAEKEVDLDRDMQEYVLGFETWKEGLLSLSIWFVNDHYVPEAHEDRNAYLSSIVLLRRSEP